MGLIKNVHLIYLDGCIFPSSIFLALFSTFLSGLLAGWLVAAAAAADVVCTGGAKNAKKSRHCVSKRESTSL